MIRRLFTRSRFVPASLVAFALLAAPSAFAGDSNKWRLQFSGAAESAGEMVLEIVPTGQEPVMVTVPIERNDGENRVARKVKSAIDRQAGHWVDAELDDGEDVLVKRHFFRQFTIKLLSSTVKDVRINFDTE
ncbi:MAG: hypothetical protein E6Q50_18800 [Lysobacter sp.]|nr:MAG: hypothetical protein E6Q50_18800 [Lysobacter sp.]